MALNIYEPLKFRSQGIEDLATRETLVITDGKISVDNVNAAESVTISAQNFNDLEGKGFQWSDGRRSKGLVFKGGQVNVGLPLNLAEDLTFKIADTDILSLTELGSTVTKSNLKVVGTLKALKVAGNANLSEVLYVSGDSNRVGINLDSPRLALGVKENNVEIAVGSSKSDTATIGTVSSSHLDIVTDNTPRITIFRTGEVRIHGRLSADEIHTEKSTLLIFKEQDGGTNYGKGLLWASSSNKTTNKQFILHGNPDRLYSTESLDLREDRSYMVGGETVLGKNVLGRTVTESSLTKLGLLSELQVAGDAAIARKLSTSQLEIGRFVLKENVLEVKQNFEIKKSDIIELSINENITIGNSSDLERSVSIFGNTVIGLSAPQPGVSLTVEGAISFSRKKFEVGSGAPTSGYYNKGDIVWNDDPKATDYIGWVCVTPGNPGGWLSFGIISSK
jgi:hypothetical protein